MGIAAAFAAAAVLFLPAVVHADTPATAKAAARVGTTPLRAGDHGEPVKALQRLLSAAGYATRADGRFGPGTARLVRRFQRARHLEPSGVADRATLAALRGAAMGSAASNGVGGLDVGSPSTPSSTTPSSTTPGTTTAPRHLGDRVPLSKGMQGHDVRILQDFLRRSGYATTVDGSFGSATVRSVESFERDQQRTVDGVVDAADIAALRSLVVGGKGTTRAGAAAPAPLGPGDKATVGPDGLAIAPASAPDAVKQIIAAGNVIAKKPYIYGGGHGTWDDRGYDCSGSVSYALHAATLLDKALPSGNFMSWGQPGPGQWVTLYANEGHIYMMVAGLRFDTSGRQQDGSRWHASSRPSSGYTIVHPPGL